MSRAADPEALPRLRRGERAAEMPGRCVGPSRSGRGARWPWGKRWGAGTSRSRGARRRVRSSVWETRCVSAERLQDCRQPRERRQATETAEASGANEASGIPGTAGSVEAARHPGAVWVNGAVGEPQVVGPAGSVWVTGIGGEEEETVYRSPWGCERKGRPGSLGHESILELWLKVQAMRAASGCGEGNRVELHPVPAGEGPVDRGVPGLASWIETSRGGLTGPWVKGQARAVPQASGIAIATGLGAGCERPSGLRGQGQAARVPPVGVPGDVETGSGIAPHLLERGQAVGVPGAVEEIGYRIASGPWVKRPTMGFPGVFGWPEAVEVPRAVEGERGCGGAAGLWERGQSVQVPGALAQQAVCGDALGLWGRGQAVRVPDARGVPRAVEEETPSVAFPGMWRRRQTLEEIGPKGIPGLWGTGQPVGVPCSTEEETQCGGDPGFRERGQHVWVETGSGGDRGSWEAAQTAEVSSPDEQKAGPGVIPGLWGAGQAVGVPRALGKETGCGSIPDVCRAEQPMGMSQVVLGTTREQTQYGGIPHLWDRQQAVGVPLAEAVPGVVREEMCCGNVLSRWERRQAVEEQEALVPAALGVCGSVHQETGHGGVSCLCRRRQAVGTSEASGVPEHRCASAGVPTVVDVPRSGRVPFAVGVSGPKCTESSSSHALNLWENVCATPVPVASGVPVAPEDLWSVREGAGSAAFPGSWGRRQAVGALLTDRVSVASEVPGLVEEETGSGGAPGSWGRRHSARVPVAAEVPMATGAPGPLGVEPGSGGFSYLPGRRQTAGASAAGGVAMAAGAPRPVWVETGSGGVSGLWGERETVPGPGDAKGPTRRVVPTTARGPGPMGENMGPGGISGLSGGSQAAGLPVAVGLCTATGLPGPVGEETLSGSVLGFSGRIQTAEMPVDARISMTVPAATRVPVLVGDTSSGDVSGIWGRSPATEMLTAARAPGPMDREPGSEGVSGLWGRGPEGIVPEAMGVPLLLGVLAAVGVPMTGRVPAAVWVTGSTGEEMNAAISGLSAVQRQSTKGPGASEEGAGGSSVLGLAGRRPAMGVSYTCGPGARLWSYPRSRGEEADYKNVPGVSGTGMSGGVNEAVEVSPVSRDETGIDHFIGHPQQSGRRQTGGMSGIRARGSNVGDSCVGEDRLRGAFQ